MTNEELVKAIKGLLNTGAVSKSVQSSTGADAAVGTARTKSNTEKDADTGAIFRDVQRDSDINVQEAWSANVKRTYDMHQSVDFENAARNRQHFDAMVSQQIKHAANLDAMNLQAVANNQNQSNLNNTLGIDRAWNINETDAFAVLLNKVVAEAVDKAIKK